MTNTSEMIKMEIMIIRVFLATTLFFSLRDLYRCLDENDMDAALSVYYAQM